MVCGVEGKTAECSECGDSGFCPTGSYNIYISCDLVIRVFCLGKKAVSPTWPISTPFALHKNDMCLKAMLVSDIQNEHIF